MEAQLDVLGNKASYDPDANYLKVFQVPRLSDDESTPLVKEFDPRSLEYTAAMFVEQGRPEMLGELVLREFLCLYLDLKEGVLHYNTSQYHEEIGRTSDLTPDEIQGLHNTLDVYRSVLRAIDHTEEMEYREMIYGDREWSDERAIAIVDRLAGIDGDLGVHRIDELLSASNISDSLRTSLTAKRKELTQ